jgi:hypothetical protein
MGVGSRQPSAWTASRARSLTGRSSKLTASSALIGNREDGRR